MAVESAAAKQRRAPKKPRVRLGFEEDSVAFLGHGNPFLNKNDRNQFEAVFSRRLPAGDELDKPFEILSRAPSRSRRFGDSTSRWRTSHRRG